MSSYYIERYPVTMAQFGAFMQAEGYREPQYWKEAQAVGVWNSALLRPVYALKDHWKEVQATGMWNHPVMGITWYEALVYCHWLTEQLRAWEGTPEPLAGLLRRERWEVQLPSEIEWEKAARGKDGRVYPWAKDPDPNLANYDETEIRETSTVGCFPGGASPSGVEDLIGNVWEWTRNLGQDDPVDEREILEVSSDVPRVLRGGAFNFNARSARFSARSRYLPNYRDISHGFRLILSPHL